MKRYGDCIIRNEKGELLLLQRSYQDDFEPGKWCLPGGKIEEGESPLEAATRELWEETNLQCLLEGPIHQEQRADSISYYFQGVAHTFDPTLLDNDEHYRLQWVPLDEVADYDLILDLGDILSNKLNLPIFSMQITEIAVADIEDLLKRQELVEVAFNKGEITAQDYFEVKTLYKAHAEYLIEQRPKKDCGKLLEKLKMRRDPDGIEKAEENDLEKATKTKAFIGEIRKFGGRDHIRTISGWKYYGKGTGGKAKEHKGVGEFHSEKVEVKPKKEVAADVIPSISDLKMSEAVSVGGSGGAMLVSSKDGRKFITKEAGTGVKNTLRQLEGEMLSEKIYAALGVPTMVGEIKTAGSASYKVTPFLEGGKELNALTSTQQEAAKKQLQKNFVLDCLLLNWDVIGASKDNVVVKDGIPYRIDNGGSLLFRAKNGKKNDSSLTAEITELSVMRSDKNPSTKSVFGDISEEEVVRQAKEVYAKGSDILRVVNASNITDKKEIQALLTSRLEWLKINYVDEKPKAPKVVNVTEKWKKKMKEMNIKGNAGIKEGIIKQVERIEKSKKDLYKTHADKRGISVAEYKQKLQEKVERMMAKAQCFRATDINVLDKILHESKRFKSQFETGTSHGSLTPTGRANVEAEYFNFSADVKKDTEMRPIYGYVSDNANGVHNDSGEHPPSTNATSYGNCIVKIKESAKDKVTFCFADSLNASSNYACTPISNPHFTSLPLSSYTDPLDMDENLSTFSGSYIECQYHDQLKVEDIESIHLSAGNFGGMSSPRAYEEMNRAIDTIRDGDNKTKVVIYGNK